MKFELHEYWKHENCKDVFFKPRTCEDYGHNVVLRGCWLTQGQDIWFFTSEDRIEITLAQYKKWKPYTPRGRFKP